MSQHFDGLDNEDVLSVYEGNIYITSKTFTVDEFIAAMRLGNKAILGEATDEKQKWFTEGLQCKLLKPGAKNWQRGKVRIRLEFCPEDLEVSTEVSDRTETNGSTSPLDDLRKLTDKTN